MIEIDIQAITEMGCCVCTSIWVSEDYTMTEVARTIKENGFKMFRILDTMKRFASV